MLLLGLVFNEVMCFGIPVIVSSGVSAASDLVKDNGYIYETNNIKMLIRFLDELVSNGEKREGMGKRSIEIISNWNYEKDMEGLLKALVYVDGRKVIK